MQADPVEHAARHYEKAYRELDAAERTRRQTEADMCQALLACYSAIDLTKVAQYSDISAHWIGGTRAHRLSTVGETFEAATEYTGLANADLWVFIAQKARDGDLGAHALIRRAARVYVGQCVDLGAAC